MARRRRTAASTCNQATVPGARPSADQSPEEVSDKYEEVMRNGRRRITARGRPNTVSTGGEFQFPAPGRGETASGFSVRADDKYDMITCLLFIDDVTLENGLPEVILKPQGPLYPHRHDGVFTGADSSVVDAQRDRITCCTGSLIRLPYRQSVSRFGAESDGPSTNALHHNYTRRTDQLSPIICRPIYPSPSRGIKALFAAAHIPCPRWQFRRARPSSLSEAADK